MQSFAADRLPVGEDSAYRRASGLLCTSQRLILQGGDAALLISGGWILINRLIMAFKLIFKIVDQVHGLLKQFFRLAAVHELSFRSEHFRNLGQDGGAALGD